PAFPGAEQLSWAKSIDQYGARVLFRSMRRQSDQLRIDRYSSSRFLFDAEGNAVGSCFLAFFLARRSREVTSSTGGQGSRADAAGLVRLTRMLILAVADWRPSALRTR